MYAFFPEYSNASNVEKWLDSVFDRLDLVGAFTPGAAQQSGAIIEVKPIEER